MENVKMNRAMALVAFLTLSGFLAVLVGFVTRFDLILIVALTLGLAGWDMWHVAMGHKEDKH
jgi:hypothetical protein